MTQQGIRRFADLKRININEPQKVKQWCDILGCSPEKLKVAIYRAGTSVDAVKKFLSKEE
jgi:hypothetical protein